MSHPDHGVEGLGPDAPCADQPPGTSVALRPHQLALLQRCRDLEKGCMVRSSTGDVVDSRIGIIGDCTGSGKSFVVLALVCSETQNLRKSASATRTFCGGRIAVTRSEASQGTPCKCTVLVVPHALVSQWEGYISAFGRGLRTLFVTRQRQVDAFDVDALHDLDLVITIGTTYNALAALLCGARVAVQRIVYDEADSISHQICLPVDASMTWFVTASYANLIFPRGHVVLDPVTNLISSTVPGMRGNGCIKALFCDLTSTAAGTDAARSIVVRCLDSYVQASLGLDSPQLRTVICRTPHSIRVLNGVVDTRVIDFLNAGDVCGALQATGGVVHDSEESVVASLIARMRSAAEAVECRIEGVRNALSVVQDPAERQHLHRERDRLLVKHAETRRNIESITARVAETETCCICCDRIKHKSVTPCCTNSFCFSCVTRWLQLRGSCPLCKEMLDPGKLLVVHADSEDRARSPSVGDLTAEDKQSGLRMILERSSTRGKTLVFSAYERTFDDIEPTLRHMGLRCRTLKGNHATVKSIVDDFRAGVIDVLLVNAKNYGSGLNLECTTDIVMFHRLDNEIERQVVGRAMRFGRSQPLTVWYLLYENEQS